MQSIGMFFGKIFFTRLQKWYQLTNITENSDTIENQREQTEKIQVSLYCNFAIIFSVNIF